MIRRLLALAALLSLLAACGRVNEKNWGKKSARVSCKYHKRCNASSFYFTFDNMKECKQDTRDAWEDVEDDYADDCDFDQKKAKECLKAMRKDCKAIGRDYDDLVASCFEVWDCPDDSIDTGTTSTAPVLLR